MSIKQTCSLQWLIKVNSMRIDAALQNGTEILLESSSSARLDTELLLAHCLGKQRSYLYTWPEKTLNSKQQVLFFNSLKRRQNNYPIAYITGYQEFWSLTLKVTPDVLIPRADTELLVEAALENILTIKHPKILELGTGSGAIALALATERPDSQIIATDFSDKALEVAEKNKQSLDLNNIQNIQSDWFEAIPQTTFDLIVSNPPYIDPTDKHLAGGIRHEPIQALTADNKGLSDLEHIINNAQLYLNIGGSLILEHGHDQGSVVSEILKKAAFQQISCLSDLGGNDRINIGSKL
jgi:release factor glutamine methyltransferase